MLPDQPTAERIMIIAQDSSTLQMLGCKALEQYGYEVLICESGEKALTEISGFIPNILIIDQYLPDLGGRDLLVALKSREIEAPAVLLVNENEGKEILQSYRMGARDVMLKPFRETELFNVLHRIVEERREKARREHLEEQLEKANYRLSMNLQEMQSLIDIQRAFKESPTEEEGFDRILDDLIRLSDANRGWIIIQESGTERYLLAACRNMPQNVRNALGKPWMDKLTQHVLRSGKPLMVSAEQLKKSNLDQLGGTALVMPIKVTNHLVGVLALTRRQGIQFEKSEIQMIHSIADYIAMVILNSQLYNGLKQRNAKLNSIREEVQSATKLALLPLIQDSLLALSQISSGRMLQMRKNERLAIKTTKTALARMRDILLKYP